jgi:hypothetical protein
MIPQVLIKLLPPSSIPNTTKYVDIERIKLGLKFETDKLKESHVQKVLQSSGTEIVNSGNLARVRQRVLQNAPAFVGDCYDDDRIRFWLMANLKDSPHCGELAPEGHMSYIPSDVGYYLAIARWFQDDINLHALTEPMIARIRERFYGWELSRIEKKDIFNFIWRIYLEKHPGNKEYDLFFSV